MADLFGRCTYCREYINGVRVQCCDCDDFIICLQCFACGAEIGPHKTDHACTFVDICSTNYFGENNTWTLQEHLKLLEVLELYPFGSWEYISENFNLKTPEELKDEYINRFLNGNMGKAIWNELGDCRPILPEHPIEDKGPLAPEVISQLPPIDVTPEEANELGYMIQRDDFNGDYDPDAEKLITDIYLKPKDDSDIEVALKLAQVDIYNRRLRERFRRRRTVRDYQLVSKFFSDQRKETVQKSLTKEQMDFRENMKVFCQFFASGEYKRLIDSLEKERELRKRLKELLKYRSLGITKHEEIKHYEQYVAYQKQQQRRQITAISTVETVPEQIFENGQDDCDNHLLDGKSDPLQSDEKVCDIQPLAIYSLPQGNLLSQHEAQLCSSLNLLPIQYKMMKYHIIQDNILSNGKNKITEESFPEGKEMSVKDIVTKYLYDSGWLPSISMK